jgi:hypothetical protein
VKRLGRFFVIPRHAARARRRRSRSRLPEAGWRRLPGTPRAAKLEPAPPSVLSFRTGPAFQQARATSTYRGCRNFSPVRHFGGLDRRRDVRTPILIMNITAKPPGAKSRNRAVVGVAPGARGARGSIAYAFYDRISYSVRSLIAMSPRCSAM